jgi:hypothetical protein
MVEFSKIQKFLKNKNKFDTKKDNATIFDDLVEKLKIIGPFIKNSAPELSTSLVNYIIDLINACNSFNIDIEKTLTEKLGYHT